MTYHSTRPLTSFFFFFNDTATTEIYTLSLHDALPISRHHRVRHRVRRDPADPHPERQVQGVGGDHRHARPDGRRGEEGPIAREGRSAHSPEQPDPGPGQPGRGEGARSEEHTSELQSLAYLVCRLLLEKKKKNQSAHCI